MTFDQLRYIAIRFEYATKKEAAEAIGLEPDTIYHWPKEVDEALRLIAIETEIAARAILKQNLIKAAMVKVAGLDSRDERIRQGSATEVLDRQLGKAVFRQEIAGPDGGAIPFKIEEWKQTAQKQLDDIEDMEELEGGDPNV
jgi:hypothetical protein